METYWRLVSPTMGSLDPAVVHFDKVMDAALCADEIGALTPSGEVVQTRVSLAPDGTAVHLIPSHPWHSWLLWRQNGGPEAVFRGNLGLGANAFQDTLSRNSYTRK
jgi:hypothetical protein